MLRSILDRIFSHRRTIRSRKLERKAAFRNALRFESLEGRAMLACVEGCTGFLTYSQGGYGGDTGNGVPVAYLNANFSSAFPAGIQIGNQGAGAATDNVITAGNRAALFTSAADIVAFLPHGGTSSALGGDFLNPVDPPPPDPNLAGALAGQTITMMLNIGFDAANPEFDGNGCNIALGDLIYDAIDTDATSALDGMTVQAIVNEANLILSGASSTFAAATLTAALDHIVQEFDGGATDGDAVITLTCPEVDTEETLFIEGFKYNDHNGNGAQDAGDDGIAGWHFTVWVDSDGEGDRDESELHDVVTVAGGSFSYSEDVSSTILADSVDYDVQEVLPLDLSWVPTQGEDGYSGTFTPTNTTVAELIFGNTNVGSENGKTIGFWSNKNGQALITQGDIDALNALHLRSATGADLNWTGALATQKTALKNFLLGASATNMANMLSAQLAATVLNARHGNFGTSTEINVEGVLTSWSGNSQGSNLTNNLDHDGDSNSDADGLVNQFGFASISALIAAAEAELTLHGTAGSADSWRDYQEALKIAFDGMNNNLAIFAQ
jgi:hypothetical protein